MPPFARRMAAPTSSGPPASRPSRNVGCEHWPTQTAIVWAPNMSVGVNLLLGLVEQVARTLDPAFDIEILELHHRHKVDAPSGTALALGRAAARGREADFDAVAVPVTRRHHRRPAHRRHRLSPSCAAATPSASIASCSAGPASGSNWPMSRPTAVSTAWARYGRPCGPPGSRPGCTGWRRCWACGQVGV